MNTASSSELLTPELAERLNRRCHCVSVDMQELRSAVARDCAAHAADIDLLQERPHLFAAPPVFLARSQVIAMRRVIAAIETVVAMPAFQQAALAWAPPIAKFEPKARGVFLGYDFHLTPSGPKLIEINTNAGGALLNAALLRAAKACCTEVETLPPAADAIESLGNGFLRMFETEWQLQRGEQHLQTIAIVDEAPATQYLYPEFLLFKDLFERAGYRAMIVAPEQLHYRGGRLLAESTQIDLVYNRLTDFDLAAPASATLRAAYLDDAAVVTPHPRAHALYADKRNLVLLSDADRLRDLGVDAENIEILIEGLPRTERVSRENADRFWTERKQWFFKPVTGFGSRGAYRGEKLTKRVWEDIVAGDYVAQAFMPPSERSLVQEGGDANTPVALKADFRNYVYAGHVQLLAARLYQGQTTNFRTPGGGFAPVFSGSDLMRVNSLEQNA